VDEKGSTAFWRAAQAADLPAMRMLIAAEADPAIPTQVVPGRPVRNTDGFKYSKPPRPIDGPAVTPLQAASGAGYDGNYHRQAPGGFLPALTFLAEQPGADVSLADDKGNTPLHNAALRGDNEMIRYLVSSGADLHALDRRGRNVSDWANGPIQRLQPFTETLVLLAELGAPPHNDRCVSC
jgi:ankyrin repeat protein